MYHGPAEISRVRGHIREGEPYNVAMMSKSRLVPWLGFGATLVAVAMLWHGGPSRRPTDKPLPPADAELAAAGEVDPTRLIVDFRDDVSAETLANNGFDEIPISDYSAGRPPVPHRLRERRTRPPRRWRSCRHDPSVESVDYEAFAGISPDEQADEAAAAAARQAMEAECQAAAPGSAFPNDACYKYQWHLRQIGMPDAWKRGNGKGVIVAVIDTGVTQGRATSAETEFVPGYNFVANNANAADDHGHGTHVAGTIAQSTNNGSASPASPTAPRSCRSRCCRRAARARSRGIAQAHPLGRRPRRQGHQHEPRRADRRVGTMAQAVKYAHDKGVVVVARRRQRRARPGQLPGRATRASIAVAATQFDETHDLLLELGQGDRHRGAGRQHARRPERRRQAGRRPAEHHRPRQHLEDRLPVVHGHVDGVAARRRRGRADRRRRA